MSEDQSHFNVIVIGSGPAGLTAAIYASRADMAPLCIEGLGSGGQLMLTTDVENYPGFPEGVMGPDMMQRFREQAERFGTTFVSDDVSRVDFSSRPFRVWVGEREYTGDSVIVSTGASARQLGVENELKLSGHGVSYCATCDGYFFRDKDIIVVGGGDSAMEEATFLSKFASSVTIVHRSDNFRASAIMLQRARSNPKIFWREWTTVQEILDPDQGVVTAVKLQDPRDGREWLHYTEGVFVAIGHTPNTQLFSGILDMDEQGYLITQTPSTRTNIPGVFACGDVQDKVYRQAVTAAGSGCAAALDAERWLSDEESHTSEQRAGDVQTAPA